MTGITGYLGTWFRAYLEKNPKNEKIIELDIVQPEKSSKLKFYNIDIRNPISADILFNDKVELVIHFAFICKELRDCKEMRDIDIEWTKNILTAIENTPTVFHLVTLSSVSAYGAHPDNPILIENSPLWGDQNKFQYARDKEEIDMIVQEFIKTHPKITVNMDKTN